MKNERSSHLVKSYYSSLVEASNLSKKIKMGIASAKLDLTVAQFRVLYTLNAEGTKMSSSDLSYKSLVMGPSTSRITRALENMGLIKINIPKEDSRRNLIWITGAGKRNVTKILNHIEKAIPKLK